MNIGGQAVIEGVMMRSPNSWAVAVRRPDGSIALFERPWRSWGERFPFLKWPWFRGGVVLAESLSNGISALMLSSREALPEDARNDAADPSSFSTSLALVLGLAVAIALFKVLPHFTVLAIGWIFNVALTPEMLLFHVLDGVIKMGIFVAYVALIGRLPDIQRLFMYHGAEHKVIHAYERKEGLTVENARRSVRLHARCGTAFLAVVILISIIVYALTLPFLPRLSETGWVHQFGLVGIKILFLFPIAGVAYEINRLAGRRPESRILRPLVWPGLAIQRITTQEPSDDQLEVAIVSVGATLRQERLRRFAETPTPDPGVKDKPDAVFPTFSEAFHALAEDLLPEHSASDEAIHPAERA